MDSIEVEDTDKFIPTWPMYCVFQDHGNGTGTFPTLEDGGTFIPIFSEELSAERYRDAVDRTAIVNKIANSRALFHFAMLAEQRTVAIGFTVDPANGSRITHILFADMRAQVMGDDPD